MYTSPAPMACFSQKFSHTPNIGWSLNKTLLEALLLFSFLCDFLSSLLLYVFCVSLCSTIICVFNVDLQYSISLVGVSYEVSISFPSIYFCYFGCRSELNSKKVHSFVNSRCCGVFFFVLGSSWFILI